MASSNLCRLCLCPFQDDYKELIDDNGQSSDAYEIASKYFDPILLIAGQDNPLILCSVCWQRIQDFYYFQQTVFEAHEKLDIKEISSVKLKVEQIDYKSNSLADNHQDEEVKNETDASAIENCDGIEYNTFSSDDERPLIENIRKVIEKSAAKQKSKGIKFLKKSKTRLKRVQKDKNQKFVAVDCPDLKVFGSSDDVYNTNNKIDAQQKTFENDAFIAKWRSDLDCVKCNNKFSNFTLLRKHFLKDHPDEKCYILCCDRKFRSRYHLVEHIRLHMNPNAYRCDVCGKCSTNSRNLTQHIKEMHSEESKQQSLECPTCFKALANKNSLKVHMETHETNLTFMCRECNKGFPSEQKRRLHERHVHYATLICDQCGKMLHNQYALKQHLLQHDGVQKRKWACGICTTELNSRSGLKRHKQLIHQDGSTVYVCSECGKVATTEIALLTHKRNVHLSRRIHKCTLCDKAFKFPRVLREHMATHTGEDLYQCPHCERTFKTNANMHHHRKKAHPQEWAKGRLNKPQVMKVDFNLVQNEVVI